MKKSKRILGLITALSVAFGCTVAGSAFQYVDTKTGEVDRQVSDTVGELLEGIFDGRTIEVEDPERQEVGFEDKNGNGIVDNAEKVGGHTVGKDVPENAVFTDTTYENATASSPGLMSAADYAKLAGFSPASDYAKKSDISGLYKYKGSKASYSLLPTEGNEVGDVWNVEDTGMNYAWTGEAWDALGAAFEVEAITNGEIDTITADA